MGKGYIYLKLAIKTVFREPSIRTVIDLLRYFSKWKKYLKKGRTSINDRIPWLTFGAIDFIKKHLSPNMIVFEFGSGGSTIFWSDHTREVVSIEHDNDWYINMQKVLESEVRRNVEYIISEPEIDKSFSAKSAANPDDYISGDDQYKGMNFKSYVRKIDIYPDKYFDVIVVDGRARPSCLKHSISKLKKGGFLILDNTEREYYLKAYKPNSGEWERHDFTGPAPYNYHFSKTTIFLKK